MPSQEPIHLFVYGTLKDPERVRTLTGRQFERIDATLSGFERVNSPLGYPYILPKRGAIVHGVLLLNIDRASIVRLDAYEAEGDLYRRRIVVVEVADRCMSAMTYVGHGIRASGPPVAGCGTAPRQPEDLSEERAPARCLRAPCAEEH
jgi:gamma-glutamylcyclotransferase (GGCT)/AIG2-like uncharacterized protein YtfP